MKAIFLILALMIVSILSHAQIGTIKQLQEDYGYNGVKLCISKSDFDSVEFFENSFKHSNYRDNNAKSLFNGFKPLFLVYELTDDTLFSFHYQVPSAQLDTLNKLFVKRYGDYKVWKKGPENQYVYYGWQIGDISLTSYNGYPQGFAYFVFEHKGLQRAQRRINDQQRELWKKDEERRNDSNRRSIPIPCGNARNAWERNGR